MLAHHPGQCCTTVRALDAEHVRALTRHFREGLDAPGLAAWLARIASLRLWIACDCRGPNEPAPVLFVRARPGATYALARMSDRPPHVSSCAFAGPPARTAAQDVAPLPSDLVRLLYRWFAAARLNLLFPYEGDDVLAAQYLALREVSRSLEVAPGQRLFDFSRTHPQGLPDLCRRLCRSAPRGHSSGIFLNVVPCLDRAALREALRLESVSREWIGTEPLPEVERLAGTEAATGPFLVFFVLSAKNDRSVRVERILAQPVHARRLLRPLESAAERRTLEILLEVQRVMLREHRSIVTIRKTMPDAPVHERGISFQVQHLGPNGRALTSLDILTADAAEAYREGIDLERDEEPLYHAVGPTEGPFTRTNLSFRSRLLALFLNAGLPTASTVPPAAAACTS